MICSFDNDRYTLFLVKYFVHHILPMGNSIIYSFCGCHISIAGAKYVYRIAHPHYKKYNLLTGPWNIYDCYIPGPL